MERPSAFLFLIFSINASNCASINCPSLMSSWPLMWFFIVLSGITGGFHWRLKCSFHLLSLSSWLGALTFAFEVLLFLLTSFLFCHDIFERLSSTTFLISLIWPWIYSNRFGMCWLVLLRHFQVFFSLTFLGSLFWVRMIFQIITFLPIY